MSRACRRGGLDKPLARHRGCCGLSHNYVRSVRLDLLGHPLVKMREHLRPRLVVAISRFLIRETRMAESQPSPIVIGRQLNLYYCLSTLRRGSEPSQLNKPIWLQPEEAAVVWMPAAFEMSFKKEGGVNLALH